jgi:DNA-binding phage protein
MPTTKSYHQYLIKSLKDPVEASAYLEAILQEENPESQLLKVALENILEALGDTKLSPDEIALQKQKIEELFNQSGSEVIYNLAQWLQKLGLELNITIAQKSPSINQKLSKRSLRDPRSGALIS